MTLEINKEQSNKINNSFDASYTKQLACVPAKVQSMEEKTLLNRGETWCVLKMTGRMEELEGYTFDFLWGTPKWEYKVKLSACCQILFILNHIVETLLFGYLDYGQRQQSGLQPSLTFLEEKNLLSVVLSEVPRDDKLN